MAGWIKIHRRLKEHWLWQDAEKLKWWLDIIISVNHKDGKAYINGSLVDCKRGQSVKSLDTWAKEWRTTKKTVSKFFDLLKNDKMILTENIKVSTRLTVCKYESYNSLVNGDDYAEETDTTTQSKRGLPSNKNVKNDKNVKNEKEIKRMLDFETFWNSYNKKNDRDKCLKKFIALPESDVLKILEHVPKYVASIKDKQFQKHPATYLHNKSWTDELPSNQNISPTYIETDRDKW